MVSLFTSRKKAKVKELKEGFREYMVDMEEPSIPETRLHHRGKRGRRLRISLVRAKFSAGARMWEVFQEERKKGPRIDELIRILFIDAFKR